MAGLSVTIAIVMSLFGLGVLIYFNHNVSESIQAQNIIARVRRDLDAAVDRIFPERLGQGEDALETRIDNDWDKMDKAAREKARAGLRALRKQRTQAAEWFGSLKSSSAGAWGHMKKGFSDAYRALYDAWEKSEKEFGSYK